MINPLSNSGRHTTVLKYSHSLTLMTYTEWSTSKKDFFVMQSTHSILLIYPNYLYNLWVDHDQPIEKLWSTYHCIKIHKLDTEILNVVKLPRFSAVVFKK